MKKELEIVAWIENDVDPEIGFIGLIAHEREIEGSYAVVRKSDHEALLAERDSAIAAQEQLERYKAEVTRLEHVVSAAQKDAARFDALQNMPTEEAQAFFWNFKSRTQRAAAIDAVIEAQEVKLN